jgi:hypothetical protein
MDMGKANRLWQEAAQFTATHGNPFSLPFPELAEIAGEVIDESSAFHTAEAALRTQRNRHAHLQREPEPEQARLAAECRSHLDTLFTGSLFLGEIPLVRVSDYRLDAVSGERTAIFERIQGASPAFRKEPRVVLEELPRGAVGFLDQHERFRSAAPWLLQDTCPQCMHSELFGFNRFEKGNPIFIAMESGHPASRPDLAGLLESLIGSAT